MGVCCGKNPIKKDIYKESVIEQEIKENKETEKDPTKRPIKVELKSSEDFNCEKFGEFDVVNIESEEDIDGIQLRMSRLPPPKAILNIKLDNKPFIIN